MLSYILAVALFASALAAPLESLTAAEHSEKVSPTSLTRPSPINPSILSDPKPEEKVILADETNAKVDPVKHALHKREENKPQLGSHDTHDSAQHNKADENGSSANIHSPQQCGDEHHHHVREAEDAGKVDRTNEQNHKVDAAAHPIVPLLAKKEATTASDAKLHKRETVKSTAEVNKKNEPITLGETVIAKHPAVKEDSNKHKRELAQKTSDEHKKSEPITLGEPIAAHAPPAHDVPKRSADHNDHRDDNHHDHRSNEPLKKKNDNNHGHSEPQHDDKHHHHKREVSKIDAHPELHTDDKNTAHPLASQKKVDDHDTQSQQSHHDGKRETPTLGNPTIAVPSLALDDNKNKEHAKDFQTSHHIPAHIQEARSEREVKTSHHVLAHIVADHHSQQTDNKKVEAHGNKESHSAADSHEKSEEHKQHNDGHRHRRDGTVALAQVADVSNKDAKQTVLARVPLTNGGVQLQNGHAAHSAAIHKRETATTTSSTKRPTNLFEEQQNESKPPQFVFPVPVDQILKNSDAAPEIHAVHQPGTNASSNNDEAVDVVEDQPKEEENVPNARKQPTVKSSTKANGE